MIKEETSEPFARQFVDSTGLFTAKIQVEPGDGPYPSMVHLGAESGSMLHHDARELGELLIRAADWASALDS